MESVDVAVIGRGLIGAAAARHLAEQGITTGLIGPAEPDDPVNSNGPFSSHGDEGRITRISGRTPEWAKLAARSIARYPDIARRSGTAFHHPASLVVSVPDLESWIDAGLIEGANIRKVDADWLYEVTRIEIDPSRPLAVEGPPAGHVNPRRLVEAQTRLAEEAGATLVRGAVRSLEPIPGGYELAGHWGEMRADRALVATGAFGGGLLERPLLLERRPRTVLLAELDDVDGLPSLIASDPADEFLDQVYWVPPVEYPDGRVCLKIGGHPIDDPLFDEEQELIDWFHSSGSEREADALEHSLRGLLPVEKFVSFTSQPCVVTTTPSGHPYIGWVDDGLAVAIGGNGAAAKSSDEIGRLAASLFTADGWTDSLSQELFEPQFTG